MKLWNIKPKKEKFQWGEMCIVSLGESGRERKRVLIPFFSEDTEGDTFEVQRNQKGDPRIVKTESPSEGWIARVNTHSAYTRYTVGCAYVHPEDMEKVEKIDMGYGAWGMAGRLGTWDEYLLAVKETPVRVFVMPSGKNSRPYWLVFNDDHVHKVYMEELGLYPIDLFMPQNEDEELKPLW
jgi:glycine cleavage system H lipoate-binding protein